MNKIVVTFITLIFALLTAAPAFAEKRVALVIGNSSYKNISKLSNPVNDAKLMADVLKGQGFEVVLGLDLEYRAMKRAIRSYTEKLERYGRDTIGFIFYAGHGLQIGGTNYLIPVGAEIGKQGDVDIEAISASSLLFGVKAARNRLNIIVLDACRNNPYRSMFRGVNRGLLQMSAPSGSLIAFSTSPGDVAADGSGKNSPFTMALAKSMRVPGRAIERVFKAARQQVYDGSSGQQLPWINSSLLGEFYPAGAELTAGTAAGTVAPAPRNNTGDTNNTDRDLAFWREIRSSKDAADYEDYLQQFPKGTFAKRAARLKRKLEKKVAVGVLPTKPSVQRNRFSPGTIFDDCNGAGWCPSMVVVPKGSFMMGSPQNEAGRDDDEDDWKFGGKQVQVTIARAFAVGRFEVTFKEWDACYSFGGCTGYQPKSEGWGRGKHPVIHVSWKDAKTYLKWLSKKTGEKYRLLSEAEWEYVARGNKADRKYWWGEKIDCSKTMYDGGKKSDCFYSEGGKLRGTSEVGRFPENPFKVHDMHGNVWEWVEDCYKDSYSGVPNDGNARAARICVNRVLRGGSWLNDASDLRSANRFGIGPDSRNNNSGFRVARSLPLARAQTFNFDNNDTCMIISRKILQRIELKVGKRFCDAGGQNEARVLKIANRAVVFLDNGARKTCAQGNLCAFDWPVKPLFRIKARADAAKGIAPQATMEPRR